MNITASERSEEERFPKGIREGCLRLYTPEKYDEHWNNELAKVFIVSLEAYHKLHSGTGESKVIPASCLLGGEAHQRWL